MGLQALAKSQCSRVAIKVRGKILFINVGDVVSLRLTGNASGSEGTRAPICSASPFRSWQKGLKPTDLSVFTGLCS